MQDNATAIYLGTDAWKRVIGGDGCATGIHPTNQNIMYGTYQYLALQGQQIWVIVGTEFNHQTHLVRDFMHLSWCVALIQIFFMQEATMFTNQQTREDMDYYERRTNSGWKSTFSIDNFKLYTDMLYAITAPNSTRGHVFVTFNGGTSWNNITGILPDRYLTDIAIAPHNASTVYVTVAGFGSSHLFKSTNAGQTWIDVGSSLPDAPLFPLLLIR